ncbi:hypothetical protein [Halomarina litorea]|uniref:hypothetical protein n=1 Tax=Halomarina litorea TaxID=2961595 RepID=UPI0020C4914D|nr:hypothetical protein [Halomarina sp. BCD28]
MATISVAVPRKGRPLEAVLERVAAHTETAGLADEVISTLRYEKAVTKDDQTADRPVYERLADYSDGNAEFSLLRDAREGFPRRIVFDSATFPLGDHDLQLVGREEPFRALRKHEFALGFDSADLVLEEVVRLDPDPLADIADINDRIDPRDTDVRVVTGLGDTVYHTLLATPEVASGDLDRSFVADYEGPLCISPRYERLVEAVLGTDALEDVTFCYPGGGEEEEAAISEAGLGVYVTVTGSTARDHGLVVGDGLFPSETVLLENHRETTPVHEEVEALFDPVETELAAL